MCLAIPGKLIEITEDDNLLMGRVDYSGTVQTACLAYVPEVRVGQYVLVHAGFAISVIDEEEALRLEAETLEKTRTGSIAMAIPLHW